MRARPCGPFEMNALRLELQLRPERHMFASGTARTRYEQARKGNRTRWPLKVLSNVLDVV